MIIVATQHDLAAYFANPSTHDAAVAHLQCLLDEQYAYDSAGVWGLVGGGGLDRLGLTRADAVDLGAVDRVVQEPPYTGPDLEETKDAAIERIRKACKDYIYAFYSQEKQFNIGADEAARSTAPPPAMEALYTHEDFLRMHAFKSEARVICNMACAEVAAATSIAAVEAIMTELEYLYGLEVPGA